MSAMTVADGQKPMLFQSVLLEIGAEPELLGDGYTDICDEPCSAESMTALPVPAHPMICMPPSMIMSESNGRLP